MGTCPRSNGVRLRVLSCASFPRVLPRTLHTRAFTPRTAALAPRSGSIRTEPRRARCYALRMTAPSTPRGTPPATRPDYAPENRSKNGGKFVAIGVFALLLVGGLATLIVVLTRGNSGIVPPPQVIPSARDVVAPETNAAAPNAGETDAVPSTAPSTEPSTEPSKEPAPSAESTQ